MRLHTDMQSVVRFLVALIHLQSFITLCRAGPLPNITISDVASNTETCSVGDVVYSLGDNVPGSTPCDRCNCSSEGVKCTQQTCEPKPGCKAVHRPDHCCPTYQCECEQEGRRYGNGEKLVDPHDPCRLCYCQGGEVICRKIACFIRNDCKPRLVPGRCCPEYDNCPLRGVSTVAPTVSSNTTSYKAANEIPTTPAPEKNKEQITIKEITPVSEIPAVTEVKAKEILPLPSNEMAGYSSSKSPLIPREATSEKSSSIPKEDGETIQTNKPSSSLSSNLDTKPSQDLPLNNNDDNLPSKISLPTQNLTFYNNSSDSENNKSDSKTSDPTVVKAPPTKISIIEEEENPAFPPIPDDLAVLSNHGDEIVPETHMDTDHVSSRHDYVSSTVNGSPTITPSVQQQNDHTTTPVPETTSLMSTTINTHESSKVTEEYTTSAVSEIKMPLSSTQTSTFTPKAPMSTPDAKEVITDSQKNITPDLISSSETPSTQTPGSQTEPLIIDARSTSPEPLSSITPNETVASHQELSITNIPVTIKPTTSLHHTNQNDTTMLNLKSALPTEILNLPSSVQETITGEDDIEEQSQPADFHPDAEESKEHDHHTDSKPHETKENHDVMPNKEPEMVETAKINDQEETTSDIFKSNIPTEVTSQTEHSAFPIETSDQKPLEIADTDERYDVTEEPPSESSFEKSVKDKRKVPVTPSPEQILELTNMTKNSEKPTKMYPINVAETVEIIKVNTNEDTNAEIIQSTRKNVLKDFISLVGDVASMSEHEVTKTDNDTPFTSEQERINTGYKSKNSNWNQNSITEIPEKNKLQSNKQKKVELEEHDDTTVSDAPPPNDKVEPTTKLPMIDDVSEERQSNEKPEKKDIEIITRTYVPSFNRKPSKVVVKKNDKGVMDEHIALTTDKSIKIDTSTSGQIDLTTIAKTTSKIDTLPNSDQVTTDKSKNNTLVLSEASNIDDMRTTSVETRTEATTKISTSEVEDTTEASLLTSNENKSTEKPNTGNES